MEENILKHADVIKIFFIYQDGKNNRRKELVKIRYTDNKSCYFVGDTIINFSKPKWRAKADIIVYTPGGTYSANVIIRDTSFSLREILYKVDIPKTWKYTQLRKGSRKLVKLPITLKFSDETEIQAETYDLSVGGFSILDKNNFNPMQTRFPCSCKIQFPKEEIINFPDGILDTTAQYIRQKNIQDNYELRDYKQYCFKFKNLSTDESMIIKNFLLKLD